MGVHVLVRLLLRELSTASTYLYALQGGYHQFWNKAVSEMVTMVSLLRTNLNQNRKERVSRCETRLREEGTLNFLKWTGARMS
jgi:hypothetical protein